VFTRTCHRTPSRNESGQPHALFRYNPLSRHILIYIYRILFLYSKRVFLLLLSIYYYGLLSYSILMRSRCCLCVGISVPYQVSNAFMKPRMYIMASEPTSTAYFINASHQSLSVGASYRCKVTARLSVSLLSVLRNDSVNTFPRQQKIVGGVVFYVVCARMRGK
jgi:hypothetical protein